MAKSVIDIIEEVKDEFCTRYCKYTEECFGMLDEEKDDDRLLNCPLNRL